MFKDISTKNLDYKMIFVAFVSALMVLSCAPVGTTQAFSQGSYLSDKTMPAMALVYSRIDYTGTYYIPWTSGDEAFTVTSYIGAMGSGFFVNSRGYLITNGHVVYSFTSKNYKDDYYTKDLIIQDAVVTMLNHYSQTYGYTFSQADVQYTLDYNRQYGQTSDLFRSVYIILGDAQGDVIEAKRGISATVVNNDPFLGRDLALLKVELTNTPALLIADSDSVSTGDTVYAFGYPGVVTFHPALSPSTLLSPSMTSGIVSAKRLTAQDISAIQHSASVTHGNSGGPLVNEEGKVVGVNNMGSINDVGLEVAGFNFAIASNVLKNFLQENGVENSQGTIDSQYQRGLAYSYTKMYASAKSDFDAVSSIFTYHWRAQQLSADCQLSLSRGEKADSVVNLAAAGTSTVKVNKEAMSVNGSLVHSTSMPVPVNITWPATQVTLEYTKPGGSTVTHTVTISSGGVFTDSLTPDVSGQWTVRASWAGNIEHNGATSTPVSFTVTEPTLVETMTDTGMIYIIPIVVIVAIVAVVFMMRRGKSQRAGAAAAPSSPATQT